jgi:hypothetical protein
MFGFSKRKTKPLTDEEYQQEFLRLVRAMEDQFAIGDSPREQLLYAMGVIEREMNGNGGCNWEEKDYIEYLDTLRDSLTSDGGFSPAELERIRRSLDEIIECGRELETVGESGRNATEAVDYLVARVVDWCHRHPAQDQV